MQEAAEVSFRGVASNHLMVLSITVKRYSRLSSEAGRGPTRSSGHVKISWREYEWAEGGPEAV
jgi:hypothetical protein